MNKEQLIRSFIILLFVFIGSIILVRGFSKGQTLSDYATENNIPIHSEKTGENEDIEK